VLNGRRTTLAIERAGAHAQKQVTRPAKGARLQLRGIRLSHEERNSRSLKHELEHSCRCRSLRGHGSHCLSVSADVTAKRVCPPPKGGPIGEKAGQANGSSLLGRQRSRRGLCKPDVTSGSEGQSPLVSSLAISSGASAGDERLDRPAEQGAIPSLCERAMRRGGCI
jgi:hypothetical protein